MGNQLHAHVFKRKQVGAREEVILKLFYPDGTPCDMEALENIGGQEDPPGMQWWGEYQAYSYPYNAVVRFQDHLYICIDSFNPDPATFGNRNVRNLAADPSVWTDGVLTPDVPTSDWEPQFTHADVYGFAVTTEGYFDVTVTGGPLVTIWSQAGPSQISTSSAQNQGLEVQPGIYFAVVGITDEQTYPYQIRVHSHPTLTPKAEVSSDIGPTPANSPQWVFMI